MTMETPTNEEEQVKQEQALPELTKLCISVPEMAKYMSIGIVTAYNMVNTESFYPAFRVGKKYVVSVDRLRQWIIEQTDSRQSA